MDSGDPRIFGSLGSRERLAMPPFQIVPIDRDIHGQSSSSRTTTRPLPHLYTPGRVAPNSGRDR
jgi:hypothetical protein